MAEPGRAAWRCPQCGFVVGWVNDDNQLVIWRYPGGFIILRCGTFACACGAVVEWRQAAPPRRVDKMSTKLDIAP